MPKQLQISALRCVDLQKRITKKKKKKEREKKAETKNIVLRVQSVSLRIRVNRFE